MKQFVFSCTLVFFLFSCGKETQCKLPAVRTEPTTNPRCMDTVPTGELCEAYFTRWFYVKESNSCQEIGYSGCSQKGFATKVECEECLER